MLSKIKISGNNEVWRINKRKNLQIKSDCQSPTLEKVGKFLDILPLPDKLTLQIKIAKESGDKVSETEATKQLAKHRFENFPSSRCDLSDLYTEQYMAQFRAAKKMGAPAEEIAKEHILAVLNYGDLDVYRYVQSEPFLTEAKIQEKKDRRFGAYLYSDFIRFVQNVMPEMLPSVRSEIKLRLNSWISSLNAGRRDSPYYPHMDFISLVEGQFSVLLFHTSGLADLVEEYAPKLVYAMASNNFRDAAPTAKEYGLDSLARTLALDDIAYDIEYGVDPSEFAKQFDISKDEVIKIAKKAYTKCIANERYQDALNVAVKYHFEEESRIAAELLKEQNRLATEFHIQEHLERDRISDAINVSTRQGMLKFFETEVVSAHKEYAVAAYLIKNEKYALLSGFSSFQIDKAAIAKEVVAAEILARNHLKAFSIATYWNLKGEANACAEYFIEHLVKEKKIRDAIDACRTYGRQELLDDILSTGKQEVYGLVRRSEYDSALSSAKEYGLDELETEIKQLQDALKGATGVDWHGNANGYRMWQVTVSKAYNNKQ